MRLADSMYFPTTRTYSPKRSGGPVSGHFWTVLPALRGELLPARMPAAQQFHAAVDDPVAGQVQLSGLYMDQPGSDTLVALNHGLGGNRMSPRLALASATVSPRCAFRCAARTAQAKTFFMAGSAKTSGRRSKARGSLDTGALFCLASRSADTWRRSAACRRRCDLSAARPRCRDHRFRPSGSPPLSQARVCSPEQHS
jgi:hypothetical protein